MQHIEKRLEIFWNSHYNTNRVEWGNKQMKITEFMRLCLIGLSYESNSFWDIFEVQNETLRRIFLEMKINLGLIKL